MLHLNQLFLRFYN